MTCTTCTCSTCRAELETWIIITIVSQRVTRTKENLWHEMKRTTWNVSQNENGIKKWRWFFILRKNQISCSRSSFLSFLVTCFVFYVCKIQNISIHISNITFFVIHFIIFLNQHAFPYFLHPFLFVHRFFNVSFFFFFWILDSQIFLTILLWYLLLFVYLIIYHLFMMIIFNIF